MMLFPHRLESMCANLHAMAKQTGVTKVAINGSDDSVKTIADSTSEQSRAGQTNTVTGLCT